jgi:hypothetical protein
MPTINTVIRRHLMRFLSGIKIFLILFSTKVLKSTMPTFFNDK